MRQSKILAPNGWNRYLTLWEKLTGWKLFLFYVLHYTLLFLLLSHFMFSDFREAGKSLIWTGDGMPQHFTRLVYLSQTIRDGIQSLLNREGWTIPLYDFRSGLTAQDLQFGFPQILVIFCPWDKIDVFYNIYVLFNYYLIGLSFSYFGFFFQQKPLPVMIGSVSYTFCGYSLFAGVRHPHFIVPMIFLPLLIIGAEKALRKEKAYLLLVMVFLSLTTQWGLYFSYMQAIFVVIYILARFPSFYRQNRLIEFGRLLGRLCVWGGTGVLLASFVAIPSLISILGIGRVGHDISSYTNFFHFTISNYEKFLINYSLIPISASTWAYLAFSVLTIPAIILLFVRRKKQEQSLCITFLVLTAMLLVPAVAYMMSGFSNISSRFVFGYAFCVAAILMFMVSHFTETSRGEMAAVGAVLIVYFIVCRFLVEEKYYNQAPFTMLFAALLLIFCCWMAGEKGKRLILPVCLLITCFSVYYTSFLRYDSTQGNYVSEFTTDAYATIEQGQYSSLSQSKAVLDDDSFYRVAGNSITAQEKNISFYYDLNGLSMYPYFGWSDDYVNWITEMELPRLGNKHMLYGLDTHAPLLSLASVKYYADRETKTSIQPFGFTEIERIQNNSKTDVILENEYFLPVGYTYSNYLSRKNYSTLDTLGKQEAQLQAVILEDAPALSSISEASVMATAQEVPYEITAQKNLTWKDGTLKVTEANATITVEFEGLPETETYLRIVNLDLTSGASTRSWTLTAATEKTSTKANFRADAYVYTHGQKTQMLDMGYTEDGYTTITITFPSKGTFLLEDIEIWCQPMDNYAEQVLSLREEVLENVETNWRGLTGTISVSTDKMLCLAIPYMDGWTAYVDGKKVKLYQANTAFMAVELAAGDHTVELRYWLPGLTAGLCLSCTGIVCLAAILMFQRKKNTH